MRVALLAFLHESNTFLATPTTYEDFARCSLTSGDAMIARWQSVRHEIGGMIQTCLANRIEIAGGMAAFAAPSGTLEADSFERIASELLAGLEAVSPIDGVLVALHGATVSASYPDADGELLRRIRGFVGPGTPIIGTLDLHANISEAMVRNSDALIAYRTNPHIDQYERGSEAANLLLRTMTGEVHPVQVLVSPPMLIRMSRQCTSELPARKLFADLEQVLQRPGILTASVAMGFYYSDVYEMGSTFLAVAECDSEIARRAATWIAMRAWDHRADFTADLPGPSAAVTEALLSTNKPVVLLDIGDNVGGGSAADSTILLAEILRQGARDSVIVLYDPEAVAHCVATGVRNMIEVHVGGKTDTLHGPPVLIKGRVRILADGIFVESQVRHGGWGSMDQGLTAVIETQEGHSIVLTSYRMPPFSLEQLLSLGLHPERKHIVVAKGVVAPRAAYQPIAARIILVDTPGVTADNPAGFSYCNRRRPMYPIEKSASFPVLS